MLSGLLGIASEVNIKDLQKDLEMTIIEGEVVVKAFKLIRDLFIFTDKRLILVDKQGITGKKASYHSIPYKSISHFTVQTAGTFDLDSEMFIYIIGYPTPIQRDFKRGTDLVGVQKTLARFILQ